MKNTMTKWKGKELTELTKEELIIALEHCGREILSLRADRNRWRESGNALKYLQNKQGQE